MQAAITRFDGRKAVGPIASPVQPAFVGVRHSLGQSGRTAGVANDIVIVSIDRHQRIIGRIIREPIFIVGIANDDGFYIRNLVADPVEFGGVVSAHDDRAAICVSEHMQVRFARVAWI